MLQNKTFTKVLSVVIALVLWVYVIGEVNPTTTKTLENIPVKLLNTENLASKGLVVLDGDSFTVNLTVEGKRADILSINTENLLVTADLFGYGLGENYIAVNVELPNGITLVSSEPSKLKVLVDELITAIKPVVLRYVGELEEGMEPGQITQSAEAIEINGARSLVEKVSYIGADVDVTKLDTELKTMEAYAFAYAENGEVISNVKLASDVIDVSARLMSTKEVPLKLAMTGEELPDLQITSMDIPKTIVIRGDVEALALVEEIQAKDIDINSYTTSTEIPIEVFLPEGIEVATASDNLMAKLVIKGLSSKSFEYNTSVIKIDGLAAGFAAEIVPSNLIVSIVDKDTVLADINSTDVDIRINLEGLSMGAHQVNVTATVQDGERNASISPTQITVNIHAVQ